MLPQEEKQTRKTFFSKEDTWSHRLVIFLVGSVGLSLLSIIIGVIVYAIVVQGKVKTPELENQYSMLTNVISYFTLLTILLILCIPHLGQIFGDFKHGKKIILGILSGVVLMGITTAYSLIIDSFMTLETNGNEVGIEEMLIDYPIIIFIVVTFMGPICEELTYRYGLFGLISKKSKRLAYITTIIIFALIHFDYTNSDIMVELINLPSYLLAAAVLCYVYDKYGMTVSLVAHITNNFVACVSVMMR